jgi:hypothetical protein
VLEAQGGQKMKGEHIEGAKTLIVAPPVPMKYRVTYYLQYDGEGIDLMAQDSSGANWHVVGIKNGEPITVYSGLPEGIGIEVDINGTPLIDKE